MKFPWIFPDFSLKMKLDLTVYVSIDLKYNKVEFHNWLVKYVIKKHENETIEYGITDPFMTTLSRS